MNKNSVSSEKKQAYSQLFNAISLLCGEDFPFVWSEEYGCRLPVPSSAKRDGKIPRIHPNLYFHPNETTKEKDHNKMYNALAWFRELCEQRSPTDKEVIWAARQIASRLQWLCVEKSDGSRVCVESNAKGTERYCKKLNGRILDVSKELGVQDLDCAFITLTCDPSKYESLGSCWASYKAAEIDPVMEHLRKNKDVQYISVVESTAKMRPHVHILAFFPKGLYPELEKLENEAELKFGGLFNYVKSRVNSPMFKIKVVKGEYKAHYLTKYIGKGATKSVFKVIEKPEEMTKEDWKLVYEFVFLTAFRKRKMFSTRKNSKREKSSEELVNEAGSFSRQESQWKRSTASQRRALLKSICANSLIQNLVTVYSMGYFDYRRVFGQFPTRNQDFPDEEAALFKSKSRMTYSEESFYTLFVSFLLNPEKSVLNYRFYWNGEEDIYDSFTDRYDLNNDESFIQCCHDLCVYYLNKCLNEGFLLQEVTTQKLDLSNMKKLRKIGFGTFDVVDSPDPKEVYMTYEEASAWRKCMAKGIADAAEREESKIQSLLEQLYQEDS